MTKTVQKVKEWQNLIAGLSLALSIAYAATAVLKLAFNAGQAVQQHNQIISTQQDHAAALNALLRQCGR